MIATHLPLLVDRTRGAHGTLAGHIARANPQQRQACDGDEALAIFSGHDAYITPAFYPSKARDGKVVPTWNYVAVHAYGALRFVSDPTELRRHLEARTSHHESSREQPWAVGDAPESYIHRVGRTARAEAVGDAVTFVSPEEEQDFRSIERAVRRPIARLERR